MTDRPHIGVTVSRRTGWRVFPLIAFNIWLAGGRAVRWQTAGAIDVEAVHGVIIGGGDDISPMLYGGELVAEARLDPGRDELEVSVLKTAYETNTPILGICRGSQMLNVTLGGTLHQHAYDVYPSKRFRTILPRKTVSVEAKSRLADLVGTEPMRVNALHSQAVDRLGEGLRIAARDDGGMIQSLERHRDPFAVGVQWHPEHLFYARRQRRLFQALVCAAQAYREARGQVESVDRLQAL